MKYKSQIKAGQSSNTEQKKNILHFEGPFYQISNLEDFSIHCWFWQRSHNLFSFPFSSPFVPCSFLSLASGNVGSHPPKETLTFREETLGFPGGWDGEQSTCNSGNLGSIPGLGRHPGEGNGNELHYSCLENSTDIQAWWAIVHVVTKSWTWLNDFHFTSLHWGGQVASDSMPRQSLPNKWEQLPALYGLCPGTHVPAAVWGLFSPWASHSLLKHSWKVKF